MARVTWTNKAILSPKTSEYTGEKLEDQAIVVFLHAGEFV